jgi:anti-sigma factor RsiW
MSDHLSEAVLTALVDGELSPDELAAAKAHIDDCLLCANLAVNGWLLKSAVAKSGQRYALPAELQERIAASVTTGAAYSGGRKSISHGGSSSKPFAWPRVVAWASVLLIFALGVLGIVQYRRQSLDALQAQRAALAAEVTDLHIASLAASEPQVVSSDRHTVKPWFQGKLPFSFNIPDTPPEGMTLEGANLAYLNGQPTAQLLFSIGRHRASVLMRQPIGIGPPPPFEASHAGFHLDAVEANGLEIIAVSDADPSRLEILAASVKDAQIQR